MIRVKTNESFPITATLIDESTGESSVGETVYYDVRIKANDSALVPPISGVLTESTVEGGIYSTIVSIPTAGNYVAYATCSGYLSNVEDITVDDYNESDVLTAVHAIRHYNISVEDVTRTTDTPTASQLVRKVPVGRTDYVITKIKRDEDSDWSDPVAQGNVYAWYRSEDEVAPYKMGGSE